MTYQPLTITCDACARRPAEHGMWQQQPDGTRHHYCWLCYQRIIDTHRRAD